MEKEKKNQNNKEDIKSLYNNKMEISSTGYGYVPNTSSESEINETININKNKNF